MRTLLPIASVTAILLVYQTVNLDAGEVASVPSPAPEESAEQKLDWSLAGLHWVSQDAHPFLRDTRFMLAGRLRYMSLETWRAVRSQMRSPGDIASG